MSISFFFFFNDTATTEIYTLSLHDALPISSRARITRARFRPSPITFHVTSFKAQGRSRTSHRVVRTAAAVCRGPASDQDRKSTRLNSSHSQISYAVFCLKKKNKDHKHKNKC